MTSLSSAGGSDVSFRPRSLKLIEPAAHRSRAGVTTSPTDSAPSSRRSDAAIAEIVDVFDLASFCQNAHRRSRHSAAAWLAWPRGFLFFTGRMQGIYRTTPAPDDWASPNQKRENIGLSHALDATQLRRTDRRRDCSARVTRGACRRHPISPLAAIPAPAKNIFSWSAHLFRPHPACSSAPTGIIFICAHPVGPPPP